MWKESDRKSEMSRLDWAAGGQCASPKLNSDNKDKLNWLRSMLGNFARVRFILSDILEYGVYE